MNRLVALLLILSGIYPSLAGANDLPKFAQPSFRYQSGFTAEIHSLRLLEADTKLQAENKKATYARHWTVEGRRGAQWTGPGGKRQVALLPPKNYWFADLDWRAKLIPNAGLKDVIAKTNSNLAGTGKYGTDLSVRRDSDGNVVLEGISYGDSVYKAAQQVKDTFSDQARQALNSPFRAVHDGYIKWRLSEDGASGPPVLVPDYYNLGLLADLLASNYADTTDMLLAQSQGTQILFEDLALALAQSFYTRKTGVNRAEALQLPEEMKENLSGNADSKALFFLSMARHYRSPLLERDLIVILLPTGAMIGKALHQAEPASGSWAEIEGKRYLLASFPRRGYAPWGVLTLDDYRTLRRGKWKYQILASPG